MNYLVVGVRRVAKAIRSHPILVAGLILLQLGLVITLGYLLYTYPVRILLDIQQVVGPLQDSSNPATDAQPSQLSTQSMLSIYQSYQSLKSNLLALLGWLLLVVVTFNGLLWMLTHRVLEQVRVPWKLRLSHCIRWLVSGMIFMIPWALVVFFIMRAQIESSVVVDSLLATMRNAVLVFFVLYYGMTVAFAVVNAATWTKFISNWCMAGVRNIHKTLLVAVINLMLVGGALLLFFQMVRLEAFWGLALVLVGVIILLFVITRLFWVACLQELTYEKNHS